MPSLLDDALARAICCGPGGCVKPEACDVVGGRRPRSLVVDVGAAVSGVRALLAADAVIHDQGCGSHNMLACDCGAVGLRD